MRRTLEPELLDSLAPNDPAAQANRRDLLLINRVMRNHDWIVASLPALLRPGQRVLEIGAGTGELGLRLARRGLAVDGLDLWPRPASWPPEARWITGDIRAFDGFDGYAAVVGNLIFHQFSGEELARLGARLANVRIVIACEPTRRRLSQLICAVAAPFVRANHVTRHDAHVSVAGGFRGDELPRALGMTPSAWEWRCRRTGMGAYRMLAVRTA